MESSWTIRKLSGTLSWLEVSRFHKTKDPHCECDLKIVYATNMSGEGKMEMGRDFGGSKE